jgi:hypothetical protein
MNSKTAVRAAIAAGLAFTFGTGLVSTCRAEVIQRPATGVTRVQFGLPGSLVIRQGQDEGLTVDADSKVLPRLSFMQKGDLLTIGSKGSFSTDKPIRVTLVVKALRSVRSTGSGSVQVDKVRGEDLTVEAAGSGDLKLVEVRNAFLAIEVSASGDISATGSGQNLRARITGSGSIDAADFVSREAVAAIEGSGEIKVNATSKLKADISGAGQIGYRGHPAVTQSISGAGSVGQL